VNPGNAGTHASGGPWAHIRNVTVEGNTFAGTRAAAICLRDDRPTPVDDDLRDVVVGGNTIEDSAAEGIAVAAQGTSDVLIRDNRVKGSAGNGIDVAAGKRIHVRNNVVYRGAASGIRVSAVDAGSIEGNQSYEDRTAGTRQTRGIEINALAGRFAFRDNHAWGNTLDYDLHWVTHGAAKFAGPWRVLSVPWGWTPGSIPAGGVASTEVTVPGCDVGAPCNVGFNQPVPVGARLVANVIRVDTVRVVLENNTTASQDLGAGILFVHVEMPPPGV
jgi:hypothetical protein